MAFNLSSALIEQFVKVTKDEKEIKTENTHYGTIVAYDGKHYVKIDGSDQLTPIPSTTTNVKDGERVRITIKDHVLTVTGNISNPSASTSEVKEVEDKMEDISDQITEFEIIVADKVVAEDIEAINGYFDRIKAKVGQFTEMEAITAEINELQAKYASLDHVTATDIEALNADIENLKAIFGEFTHISTEDIEAINAEFDDLKAYNATFTYVSAEVLEAMKADIKQLDVDKLNAKEAEIKYANIDFSNIGEAAVEKIFSESGIIKDLIVSEGKITGELVGVTIKGDLIEGNTIKADKLVIKGSDGIYYKLNIEGGTFKEGEAVPTNGLHGSVITAKSITAEKVAVTDLVAFGATIGGFHIGQNSLYSDVKSTVDNTTRGIYMDTDGQFAIGDSSNFIKFYKDTDGTYKLAVSASKVSFVSLNDENEEEYIDVEEAIGNVEEGLNEGLVEVSGSIDSKVQDAKDEINTNLNDNYYPKDEIDGKFESASSDLEAAKTSLSDAMNTRADELNDLVTATNGRLNALEDGIVIDPVNATITIKHPSSQIGIVFATDKISFMQSGYEVAYISSSKLFIEDSEFVDEVRIGNFAFVKRDNGSIDFKKVR